MVKNVIRIWHLQYKNRKRKIDMEDNSTDLDKYKLTNWDKISILPHYSNEDGVDKKIFLRH